MKESNRNISGTVLIIDDDQRNIFALSAVLKSRSVNAVCASSAAEGLSLLNSDPAIRMVLIDMMMPEMDGYEAIKVIRRTGLTSLPVVAVTAQAMLGDRDKCLAAGADAYLSKPIDVDQLMDLVNRMIK